MLCGHAVYVMLLSPAEAKKQAKDAKKLIISIIIIQAIMTWVLSPFYQTQLQVLTTKFDSVLIRLCRVSSCRHCVIFFYNHRICLIYPLLTQYIRTNKKSLHFIHDYSANDKARISLCTTITALGFSCTKKILRNIIMSLHFPCNFLVS